MEIVLSEIDIKDKNGNSIVNPKWLNVVFRTPEPVRKKMVANAKLPYRLTGGKLGKIELKELENLENNQLIRVKVEVYDNRDVDIRGIIGSDMSVSVNVM